MFDFSEVKNYDPELAEAMENELTRQRTNLELIASENLVSKAVMAAMGSHLTNKYAEGYPGKRYYGGCQYVDVVEDLQENVQRIIWMRICKCTATLWSTGKHGSILRSIECRRYIHGNELRPRWTFNTRKPSSTCLVRTITAYHTELMMKDSSIMMK